MSQLNNEENNVKKIKKDNSIRNIICFLILFASISISITIYLINTNNNTEDVNVADYNTNTSDEEITQKPEAQLKDDGVNGIDNLFETYTNNALKTERYVYAIAKNDEFERVDENESIIDWSSFDTEQCRYYGYYIQISGLKNKEIEGKINNEIKTKFLNIFDSYTDENIERVNVNSFVISNFANVLSISVYEDVMYDSGDVTLTDDTGDVTYDSDDVTDNLDFKYYGLNYDLNTGEFIKFSDLFTYDASIKNILTHCAYNSLVWRYSDDLGTDMSKVDYSEVEDDVFKVISKYNNNPDIDFYFSPNNITAVIDDYFIDIPMVDYHSKIAIYNRFNNNENLFEENNELQNVLNVFVVSDMDDRYNRVEKISDNLYVNIEIIKSGYNYNTAEDYSVPEEDFDEVLRIVNKNINDYKNKNDGKGRYYSYHLCAYHGELENKYEYYENCYTADLDYCKDEFFPYLVNELIESSSYEPIVGDIYYDSMKKSMKKKIEYEEYNNYDEFYVEYNDENVFDETIIEDEYIVDGDIDLQDYLEDGEIIIEETTELDNYSN